MRQTPVSLIARASAALVALLVPLLISSVGPATAPTSASVPSRYTFVSYPDFTNADIGDTALSPFWSEGDPNSINESYRLGFQTVIGQMLSEEPNSILVAGDTVNGYWGQDDDGTGIFGPVATDQEKRQAIAAAGDLYYSEWWRRFAEVEDQALTEGTITHRPEIHVAIGDHELGDNPWSGTPENDFKRSAMPLYRRTWAEYATTTPDGTSLYRDHPTGQHARTAYATMLSPDILLVTVDVFHRSPSGVDVTVTGAQLAWLDGVLSEADAAGVPWIIVQGHVPVIFPVRARGSSGLHLAGGIDSAFWKTLVRHHVDLYLCGEVHDTTARQRGGVMQICHGRIFTTGHSSYLVGTVEADRLSLSVHDLNSGPVDSTVPLLWQTSHRHRPPGEVNYTGGATVVGTMTLGPANSMLDATGNLVPYEIAVRMAGRHTERSLSGRAHWTIRSTRPGATFQYETRTATGSSALGPRLPGAWSESATLSRTIRDGHTICARGRGRLVDTGLTSAWSGWRCVVAPYDDRVFSRASGSLRREPDSRAYRRTRTALLSVGASVTGPWIRRSADRVAIGAFRSPVAGTVLVYVGRHRIGTIPLRSDSHGYAWLDARPRTYSGRLRLLTRGTGPVLLDGVEVTRRR
jgi:hypothetical protein